VRTKRSHFGSSPGVEGMKDVRSDAMMSDWYEGGKVSVGRRGVKLCNCRLTFGGLVVEI
jgi:hypothetical protein